MNLFNIEWLKLKTYKTFWILVGLYMILSILGNYVGMKMMQTISSGTMNMLTQTFSFPGAWDYVSNMQSWFVIFLVFFVIISISNEFTFKTHRQHIIDGLSRLDFLHSKFILIFFIATISVIFFLLLTVALGLLNGGGNPIPHSEKILYVFVYTFNYCSFAALITYFIRRTGLSIIIFFAYVILETFISSFINIKTQSTYGNLMPLQASDELLPIEALKSIGNLTGQSNSTIPNSLLLGVSIAFIALYYFILRRKLMTTDL